MCYTLVTPKKPSEVDIQRGMACDEFEVLSQGDIRSNWEKLKICKNINQESAGY